LDKKGIQTFDEAKGEIKYKISKDSRSQLSRNSVITRIKKENNFSEDFKALDQLVEKVDTSYLSGKWSIEKVSGFNKTLFTLGIEKTTQQEFAKYISDNQTVQKKDALPEALVRKAYAAFRDNKIISYEDVRLEEKYPEFRLLMQEYHDGILLFDITNELVWDKAIKDSAGLAEFHEKNKNNYLWGDRIEAAIYKSKDEKTAKAVRKLVNKRNKKGYSIDFIKKKINKNSELNLQTEEGIFSKGDNETIDKLKWVQGLSLDEKTNDGLIVFVEVIRLVPPGPKSLPEAKGLITSDYQTFLEKQWIKELKAKYQVKVDEEVFKTIR
jgi:peptidyl-prolyl cis-trans isomerase SurA